MFPDQVSDKAKGSALDYWVNCRFPSNEAAAAASELRASLRAAVLRVSRGCVDEPRCFSVSYRDDYDNYGGCGWDKWGDRWDRW